MLIQELKKLAYAVPNFLQPKQDKFGMVVNISNKGEIIFSHILEAIMYRILRSVNLKKIICNILTILVSK